MILSFDNRRGSFTKVENGSSACETAIYEAKDPCMDSLLLDSEQDASV